MKEYTIPASTLHVGEYMLIGGALMQIKSVVTSNVTDRVNIYLTDLRALPNQQVLLIVHEDSPMTIYRAK